MQRKRKKEAASYEDLSVWAIEKNGRCANRGRKSLPIEFINGIRIWVWNWKEKQRLQRIGANNQLNQQRIQHLQGPTRIQEEEVCC